jgi:hypothetical protein
MSSRFDSGPDPFFSPWLPGDRDGDGWEPPEDCDDDDEDVNPDATDLPYNGIDEDCDGADLIDVDGDGWDAEEVGGDDCADVNASIHPEADETCDDGRDNDCDGHVDEGCSEVDPTDPGGLSWTCAQHASPVLPMAALLALGLVLARRSAARG